MSLSGILQSIFMARDDQQFVLHYSHFLVIFALGVVIAKFVGYSAGKTYGRYVQGRKWAVPGSVAWFLQESPSFIVPVVVLLTSRCPDSALQNRVVLGIFMLHYFNRSFVYPTIRVGKPMPIIIVIGATAFCLINGYAQSLGVLCYGNYSSHYFTNVRFILGVAVFAIGFIINIWSDYLLANLRKPGEKSYKIPKGGLFEYVSCANFFGEITEWWGYALAANVYVATSFAIFSTLFLCTRALSHHEFYKEKFRNYPEDRKAVLPFLL